jgi:hypothetical protein
VPLKWYPFPLFNPGTSDTPLLLAVPSRPLPELSVIVGRVSMCQKATVVAAEAGVASISTGAAAATEPIRSFVYGCISSLPRPLSG